MLPELERPLHELAFRTVPLWQALFGRGFLENVLAGATVVILSGVTGKKPADLVMAAVIAGLFVFGSLAYRFVRVRHGPAMSGVQLFQEHLLAPTAVGSDNVQRMDYAGLISLTTMGSGPRAKLWFGTKKRVVRYLARDWREPASHERFVSFVRHQLGALPDGGALLALLDERNARAHAACRRTPRVTLALLASLVVAFVWLQSNGALSELFGLVRFGANASALVRAGQLYRLSAANFLHASFVHLAVNCLSLWALGAILARLVGHARFLLIYLGAALTGSIASAAFSHALLSVGASTAIFGLLGAFAVLSLRYDRDLPAGFRLSRSAWIGTLAINALLPILVPQIDIAAHAGGLLGGALLTELMYRRRALDVERPAGIGARLATALLLSVFAICLAIAGFRSKEAASADVYPLARAIADDAEASAGLLNAVAWHYALQTHATAEALALAQGAAERGLALSPDDPDLMDTLATVHYRSRQFDAAIALERALLERGPGDAFKRAQMARFLAARYRSSGPLEHGVGAHASELRARLRGPATAPRTLSVDGRSAYPDGAELWLLGLDQGQLRGYCWVRLAPGTPVADMLLPLADSSHGSPGAAFAGELELSVALLDTTGCRGCEPLPPPRCEPADEEIRP